MSQQAERAMKRAERQGEDEYIGQDEVSEIQEELEKMLIDIYPKENLSYFTKVQPDPASK
jgi:hypothetical protein